MSEVKWSEVKHLYLGCEAMPKKPYDQTPVKIVEVREGSWYKVKGLYSYAVMSDRFLTPILRPLEDMTGEEAKALDEMFLAMPMNSTEDIKRIDAAKTFYLLKRGFDLFNLISSGQAISKNDKG